MDGKVEMPSLAELVSTLSIASDLGMGRPVERVLRQTVIAMRLADAAGVAPEVRATTYYTSLLTWVGCATDTSDLTALFGDEEGLYADTHDDDLTPMAMGMFVARHLGRGGPALRRVGLVGRFLATAGRSVQKVMEAHCQAAGDFADRLGLGDEVRMPLLQAFERWDGKGMPGNVGSDQVAPADPVGPPRRQHRGLPPRRRDRRRDRGGAGATGHAVRPRAGRRVLRPRPRDPCRPRRAVGVGRGDRASTRRWARRWTSTSSTRRWPPSATSPT